MTGRRIRLAPALVVPVLNAIVLTNHTDQDIVLTDVRPLDVADATVEEVFVTTIPVLADGTHEVPGVNGPWPRPEPHEWLDRTPIDDAHILPGDELSIVFEPKTQALGARNSSPRREKLKPSALETQALGAANSRAK